MARHDRRDNTGRFAAPPRPAEKPHPARGEVYSERHRRTHGDRPPSRETPDLARDADADERSQPS